MTGSTRIDAVGRILSTLTGTGFVVDKVNRLIVTCRHVVQGNQLATFELPHLGYRVDCDVEEAPADKHDWALLTARTSLPEQVSELTLHQFRWNGCGLPFTTYGFAKLYATVDAGAGYLSGEVRGYVKANTEDNSKQIDLYAKELSGKTHEDVLGLSGAPCFVNGAVVGLIWASLTDAVGSTLRAIPAEVLHYESDKRIPVADAVMLPYETIFISRLELLGRSTLELAGKAIDIDDEDGDDATYRRRLAQAMISGGLTTTVRALVAIQEIPERAIKELAILAESLWIDALAAETASMLATAPLPRGLLWNAIYDTTTLDLLRRACWHHKKTRPSWHVKGVCLIIHNPTGESRGAGLIKEIAEHFKHELNKRTPDEIKDYLASVIVSPVFAVIFEPVPSPEVLAALAQSYPGLRVLFIAPQHRADITGAIMIRPEMTAHREVESLTARERARDELKLHLHLVIEGKDFRL